jgi:long-chain acyl-CoA synthetase
VNLVSIIDGHPDDAVALVSRGAQTTYGELRDQVARVAGGLQGLGLEPGDRMAIVCGTNWYFVIAYLAALKAGLVAVPLNPQSPAAELADELATVGARAAIVGPAGEEAMAEAVTRTLPEFEHLVVCRSVDLEGSVPLDELLTADPVDTVPREEDDLAALMFTSGTAGLPRAAMLSHGNLSANIEQAQDDPARRRNPDDVVLGVLPLFHIFGLNVVLGATLAVGARIVLIERFDPASCLETVARHGVTDVTGPPTMWAALAAHPGGSPVAVESVRRAASGASRLTDEIAHAVKGRLGLDLKEGYGLTETAPVVATSVGTDAPIGSIGRPIAGVEVRLVDEEDGDVYVGDPGEIWVRGPNVFHGYWNDPEATARALTDDGWLRTGDIAVVDDDGCLYLVDRAKDLIIVSGFNVAPAEVEDVLVAHPDVVGAAVVGVEHPHTGKAVKAFVMLTPGAAVEEDELINHVGEHLARYKAPTKVMFVDEIPHGLTGKVLRRELREV